MIRWLIEAPVIKAQTSLHSEESETKWTHSERISRRTVCSSMRSIAEMISERSYQAIPERSPKIGFADRIRLMAPNSFKLIFVHISNAQKHSVPLKLLSFDQF